MISLILQTVKVALWIPCLLVYFVVLWAAWGVGRAFSNPWLPLTCYVACVAGVMLLPFMWLHFAAGIVTIFSIQWGGLGKAR